MSNIRFGSQVYTWFMQGTGKGYDNKLEHMIKVAAKAGFTGIEPMVLEISKSALGCSKYWLGPENEGVARQAQDEAGGSRPRLCLGR